MSLTIAEGRSPSPGVTQMHELHPVVLSLMLTAWFDSSTLRTIHGDNPERLARAIVGASRPLLLVNSDADCVRDLFSVAGIRGSLAKADIHPMCVEDIKELFKELFDV